ncbi:MAG: hypothetical protein WCF18_20820 [Chthoniobacteraceae bacterium]
MPLIDSDSWEAKFISLKQLHFHPANPRMPELGGRVSEREIIHELCLRGGIENLARKISEKGYLRNDRLVVFRENGKNIVYEGNRRLCALKLLTSPDLAPPSRHKTFRRLAEKARLPAKIAVEVVPSKFDAEVVMYSKHADAVFTVNWKPVQQAAFIVAKLDQGAAIESVCNDYGLSRESVLDAIATVDLYRLSRLAPLTTEARALVDDPANFPYSTVYERLVQPKKSREALGVEITDGGLVIKSSEEAFLSVLARILDDAAHERITTRVLNNEDAQLEYVAQLNFRPGGGRFTAADAEAKRKESSPHESPAQQRTEAKPTPRTKLPTKRLLPSSVVIGYEHEKLSRMIEEGKKLTITDSPHACALLLRSILEISLSVCLKRQRLFGQVPSSNPKHGPSLGDMLGWVNQNPAKLGLDPHAKSALEALVSRAVRQSKPQLDRLTHSPDVIAHGEEVVGIREQALPLLAITLAK